MSGQRFSELFALELTQGALDFVNIDVVEDSPVYIDPHAIRTMQGAWINDCQVSISTYFDALLASVIEGKAARTWDLIAPLSEPNETHLGESVGASRGRSLGTEKKARELITALQHSRAVTTGLLKDLEETILFVDGIGTDILSDITTCLIRAQLIEYTQNQCNFHGIPMEPQYSGPIWNPTTARWNVDQAHDLPRGPDGPLLLVPKALVRVRPELDKGKFFRGYLRPLYEQEEISKGAASEFVRLISAGTKQARYVVLKKKLDGQLGTRKADIVRHAERFPQAIERYRADTAYPAAPIDTTTLTAEVHDDLPDFDELLDAIGAIAPGKAGATSYHRAVAAFLTALFSASLGNQRLEVKEHGGLKRVDITFDNIAVDGFFGWLKSNRVASLTVPVECKNYSADPGNPELDQIAMRLSPTRGQFGLLVTRSIENKARMDERCRAITTDQHGFVVALDDDDLRQLATETQNALDHGVAPREFPLLRERFGRLMGEY